MIKLNSNDDKNSAAMNIEDYNFEKEPTSIQDYGNLSQAKNSHQRTVIPSRDVSNLRGKTETRAEMI